MPSVTGEGEVLFCLRQSSLPSVLERQRIYNSLPPGSFSASVSAGEGEVRKMRSPQMMGVPPLQEGSFDFQTRFFSKLQDVGKFLDVLTPF